MKRTILLLCAVLTSSLSFAAGFSKDSPQLNALGSAWKSQNTTTVQKQNMYNHNDLMIVYGGQDMAGRVEVPALAIA